MRLLRGRDKNTNKWLKRSSKIHLYAVPVTFHQTKLLKTNPAAHSANASLKCLLFQKPWFILKVDHLSRQILYLKIWWTDPLPILWAKGRIRSRVWILICKICLLGDVKWKWWKSTKTATEISNYWKGLSTENGQMETDIKTVSSKCKKKLTISRVVQILMWRKKKKFWKRLRLMMMLVIYLGSENLKWKF